MAMTPPHERSKPQLHNFSLPCLKWGNQRLLRCVKVTHNDHHQHQPSSSSIPNGFQSKPTNLETFKRQRPIPVHTNLPPPPPDLPFDNNHNKRLKGLEEEPPRPNNDDQSSPRPWNLRTRRAACKAPLRIEDKRNGNALEIDSPRRQVIETLLVKRQQSVEVVKEKVKFSVPLSKEEVEQDFLQMARIRPPRRPKKRPRIVQKYLDGTNKSVGFVWRAFFVLLANLVHFTSFNGNAAPSL
ncbi:hypothetical protein Tsubulata_038163 [Turnera subulata]|uniref:Uncharacterized protein n=1 Tax=Turnera subulata TaxID=218843 RepID=A0A9Q0G8N7_9ROSI|nr:hypothetical protein Tsubulata_038163 [Turnera subulata]